MCRVDGCFHIQLLKGEQFSDLQTGFNIVTASFEAKFYCREVEIWIIQSNIWRNYLPTKKEDMLYPGIKHENENFGLSEKEQILF